MERKKFITIRKSEFVNGKRRADDERYYIYGIHYEYSVEGL